MNELVRHILVMLFPKWVYRIEKEQREEYILLDRLKMDCDYYINESSHPKFLWAESEAEQIAYMKKLYRSLVIKPEWITMKDIKRYEKLMVKH